MRRASVSLPPRRGMSSSPFPSSSMRRRAETAPMLSFLRPRSPWCRVPAAWMLLVLSSLSASGGEPSALHKDYAMSVTPNAITVYAGRLSLTLPSQAFVQINGADYNGVQVSEPYEKSLATGSTLESLRDKRVDELWKLHVKQVDESFGPGKSIVIRRDPVGAHPAMLYRALPGSTLGAQDKVIQELWTLIDGHIISLSIQGLDSEQPATFAVLTRGCYEVASLMSLLVMRMAKAMKCIPLSVCGSRS